MGVPPWDRGTLPGAFVPNLRQEFKLEEKVTELQALQLLQFSNFSSGSSTQSSPSDLDSKLAEGQGRLCYDSLPGLVLTRDEESRRELRRPLFDEEVLSSVSDSPG